MRYKMTETRGRVLIISNKYEWTNQRGELVWRKGADKDHQNMKRMFESFGFIVSGEHKNYTSKVEQLTIMLGIPRKTFEHILLYRNGYHCLGPSLMQRQILYD